MIKIEAGYLTLDPKLQGRVNRISMNAAHVSARIDGQPTDIRGGNTLGDNWYDAKHARVMRAVEEFEAAMVDLLAEYLEANPKREG